MVYQPKTWFFVAKVSFTLLWWSATGWVSTMQMATIYHSQSEAEAQAAKVGGLVKSVSSKGVTV